MCSLSFTGWQWSVVRSALVVSMWLMCWWRCWTLAPKLPQEICSKPTLCHRPCESQWELKPDGLASVLAPAGNQKAAGW